MQLPPSIQSAFDGIRQRLALARSSMLRFYRVHWILLASAFTIVSILLIVWARLGFTLEVNRFFAAAVHAPSALSIQCSATQNVLTWTLPAGHDSNSILRSMDGATNQWVCGGPNNLSPCTNLNVTTYTDTNIQPGHTYVYRHKAWADTASNAVTCSTVASPTPTATPTPTAIPAPTATPAPSNTPIPTMTVVPTPFPTITSTSTPPPRGSPSILMSGENISVSGGQSKSIQIRTGQVAEIRLQARNASALGNLSGAMVMILLPPGITYIAGSTTIAGIPTSVDTIAAGGLSLGMLGPSQSTTITLRVNVSAAQFVVGTTQLQSVAKMQTVGDGEANDSLVFSVTKPAPGTTGVVQTGPGDALLAAFLISSILTLLYVSYTHTSTYKRHEVDAITSDRDPLDFRS